jgi:tRNA(fMet)-specific endonuclease VapC
VPVLLDTYHLSVLQWQEQPACDRLLARLDRLAPDDIATTIVTYHEQMLGCQALLSRARKSEQVVIAYARLEEVWRWFLRMNVLSYTADAQVRFEQLRRQAPRLPTMDLRIASIALITGSTVLTRNLRDFRRVPGLNVEDWTA